MSACHSSLRTCDVIILEDAIFYISPLSGVHLVHDHEGLFANHRRRQVCSDFVLLISPIFCCHSMHFKSAGLQRATLRRIICKVRLCSISVLLYFAKLGGTLRRWLASCMAFLSNRDLRYVHFALFISLKLLSGYYTSSQTESLSLIKAYNFYYFNLKSTTNYKHRSEINLRHHLFLVLAKAIKLFVVSHWIPRILPLLDCI